MPHERRFHKNPTGIIFTLKNIEKERKKLSWGRFRFKSAWRKKLKRKMLL